MNSTTPARVPIESRLFAGALLLEPSLNTLHDDQVLAMSGDIADMAARGVEWLDAVTSLKLSYEAAREVAHYLTARQQLLDALHQPPPDRPATNHPAALSVTPTQREAHLQQRTQLADHTLWLLDTLGINEAGFTHLVTLYHAWRQGRGAGVEATLITVHDALEEKPFNPQILRFALLSLNLLPTAATKGGRAGTSGRCSVAASKADAFPSRYASSPLPTLAPRDLAERLTQQDLQHRLYLSSPSTPADPPRGGGSAPPPRSASSP